MTSVAAHIEAAIDIAVERPHRIGTRHRHRATHAGIARRDRSSSEPDFGGSDKARSTLHHAAVADGQRRILLETDMEIISAGDMIVARHHPGAVYRAGGAVAGTVNDLIGPVDHGVRKRVTSRQRD